MGELLLKKLIAEKLGCTLDDLEQRGVVVASAGVAATPGCTASAEAIAVMNELGFDLSKHESQPLSDKLVRQADMILTMTASHRQAILRRWPEASSRTLTLSPTAEDISDPVGGTVALYRECADQIEVALRKRIETVDFS
jgi:protein-tyrosine phosphatase